MDEFVDYLREVFELFGPIRARKMFSGYGIYHNGLMFGLVAGDTLYLKGDAENANHREKEGLGRFEYSSGERVVKMPTTVRQPGSWKTGKKPRCGRTARLRRRFAPNGQRRR